MRTVAMGVGWAVLAGVLVACAGPPRADSAEHVQELLVDLPGVTGVESERVELDSEYWGVVSDVRIASDITVGELAAVLAVLQEADDLVDEEAGFFGTVLPDEASALDDPSTIRSGSDRSPTAQAAAFLGARDLFPEATVSVDGWGLEIGDIDARGRSVSAIATEVIDTSTLAALGGLAIGVRDTVEGGGSSTLTTAVPMASETVDAWQSAVDIASTLGGGASVQYVNVNLGSVFPDRIEVNLLGVGESGAPDFATWQPVLAPALEAWADLAVAQGTDATLKVMVDHEAFVLVDAGPPPQASEYADPVWNQSVVDHLLAR